MKITLLALSLFALVGSVQAAPVGDSSNPSKITPGSSSAIPFGAGKPGISIDGSFSINLENGPIKHIRQKQANTPINSSPDQVVNANTNPQYLMMKDVNPVIGFFNNQTLGQIWYEKRANNTDVYSIRQIANPAILQAPKFGGLVIAKVPNLPAGTSVYFGEWAPRAGTPSTGSDTHLGLNQADHTVWFVGENPTGNTQNLAAATYKVVGVNQHTPGQNDFYTGNLTATFGSAAEGSLAGNLARGSHTIDFTGTKIANSQGTFNHAAKGIDGRFYGAGAAALAGYVKNTTPDRRDDVAFGGTKQ